MVRRFLRLLCILIALLLTSAAQELPRFADRPTAYVPLDSWVYPAFDRFAALGLAPSAFANLRPWTRNECARIVMEAEAEYKGELQGHPEALRLFQSLRAEFEDEIDSAHAPDPISGRLESIYTRFTGIVGTPIQADLHFGQSLANDFGRPFQRGSNLIVGFSASGRAGPLLAYASGEFQRAPGAAGYPLGVRQAIGIADRNPVQPDVAVPSIQRFRLMDSYLSVSVKSYQISFGKQSLWWGPNYAGAMLFTNNAAPITMLRIDRVMPTKLPSIFGLLGPIRGQSFVGRLEHSLYSPDYLNVVPLIHQEPYIQAQKFSFKPTPNLEVGVSYSGIFGGPGMSRSLKGLLRSVVSSSNFTDARDSGDRRAAFDVRYRVPFLRDRLVFNYDSMTDDERSPIGYPRHSVHNFGIYMPVLPKLPKWDLVAEGVFTDVPDWERFSGSDAGYFYYNQRFRSGYTHDGRLLAHPVGRDGVSIFLATRYWRTPQDPVQVGFRRLRKAEGFLKGGNINDVWGRASFQATNNTRFGTFLQVERNEFPLLGDRKWNVAASFKITYDPRKLINVGRK